MAQPVLTRFPELALNEFDAQAGVETEQASFTIKGGPPDVRDAWAIWCGARKLQWLE